MTTNPTTARAADTTVRVLRIAAVLTAISVLYQAYSASAVINEGDPALGSHQTGAIVLHVLTGLLAIAAAVHWRARRGPLWPTLLAVVVFAATFLEASLGHKSSLWVHVPLAMLIIGATTAVLVWAFSSRPVRA